ncbi:MAG: Hsp20/alpha crystallin family protein [Dysgonamonadaceae bacterium]|jgi:HSP20 family protein|nr:Hsp20/alpha crystallin family protein [Dysgonamonadaceae bacterium]
MTPIGRTQNWLPNSLFNDFFNDDLYGNVLGRRQAASPAVNIVETKTGFRIEIGAPGVAKEDFKVDIDKDNLLTISAEKKTEKEDKNERYLRKEFGYSQFKQTLILPDEIDKDVIAASYENGVLSVSIPKKAKSEKEENRVIDVL